MCYAQSFAQQLTSLTNGQISATDNPPQRTNHRNGQPTATDKSPLGSPAFPRHLQLKLLAENIYFFFKIPTDTPLVRIFYFPKLNL
jgi:hypothetical protein